MATDMKGVTEIGPDPKDEGGTFSGTNLPSSPIICIWRVSRILLGHLQDFRFQLRWRLVGHSRLAPRLTG